MGAPAIPTYKQAFGSLSNEYDPQTKLINSQIAQLAPQQAAEQASLDQAKVNAFSDINRSSNARGVMFSGVPVDKQAQYVGTKYLPAVANLKSTFQGNRNTLLGQINALNSQRVQEAKGNISAAQQNYNNYIKAQADAQYKQAELALRAQSNAISASKARSSGGLTPYEQYNIGQKQAAGFKVKQGSQGQYMFSNVHGAPISLAEYAYGVGAGTGDVKDLLMNGTSYDKKVYAKVKNLSGDKLAKALTSYQVYGNFL